MHQIYLNNDHIKDQGPHVSGFDCLLLWSLSFCLIQSIVGQAFFLCWELQRSCVYVCVSVGGGGGGGDAAGAGGRGLSFSWLDVLTRISAPSPWLSRQPGGESQRQQSGGQSRQRNESGPSRSVFTMQPTTTSRPFYTIIWADERQIVCTLQTGSSSVQSRRWQHRPTLRCSYIQGMKTLPRWSASPRLWVWSFCASPCSYCRSSAMCPWEKTASSPPQNITWEARELCSMQDFGEY